ncbi:MAG: hypothetical protein QXM96_01815 [Candidatus Woesearchaeota archaeon]
MILKNKIKKNNNKTKNKILIISTCQDKLSEEEFVKPIVDIIEKSNLSDNKNNSNSYFVKSYLEYQILHYKSFDKNLINLIKNSFDKIIITGTALKDNSYLDYIKNFQWLKEKDFKKEVLGICSGMQIIGLVHGSKIIKSSFIGFNKAKTFEKNKLFSGLFDVYEIHNNSITKPKDFIALAKIKNRILAIKHKEKEIYGLLFHPEVRNKEIIENFLKLNN